MKRKTPQEKKALSYAKDCRNTYGENDKASRKNIPLRKAKVNRGYRKKVNQVLRGISGKIDLEKADLMESEARKLKRDHWKKYADEPLGKVVEKKLERREEQAGKGKTARKKLREFVANLKIETKMETDGRWIAQAIGMNGVLIYGKTKDDAIERCKQLARVVFLESLDAAKVISVGDDSISIVRN